MIRRTWLGWMTSGVQRDPLDEHRSSLASLSELRAQTLLASSIPASALIATVLPNQGLAISAGYAAPPLRCGAEVFLLYDLWIME